MTLPVVNARRCSLETDRERVARIVYEMIDELPGLAEHFASCRKIAVKSNIGIMDVRWHRGWSIALADAAVVEGTIAWLRDHSDAEIIVGDASTGVRCEDVSEAMGITERIARYDARIVDYNDEPYTKYAVPDGGLMFSEYVMTEHMATADAVVSIAKMKSHLASGATLTLKNLFGIPPTSVYGSPRRYLHAPIRLPRVLADLGLILRPSLCVIDGIVGQTKQEWHSDPVEAGWLIAGDNTVATDAIGLTLMGIRPDGDYPEPPFHFDRNPVLLAAQRGLGPISLDGIDLLGDPLEAAEGFYSDKHMDPPLLDAIRYSIAEQAHIFVDDRARFLNEYPEQYVGLYDGDVIFTGTDLDNMQSRGQIARERGKRDKGLYLKRVEPSEIDPETFSVYEGLLARARA
ncbi:DUF362 domain-containing protein [Candidatus Poribacteria bacterium]|nr:DUF362 domain-containing protein [Candidatus Poribacteria bacterium]